MASNIADLGGYDCTFVGQPPDDLICLICTFVSKDPQQVTCCGKIFCRACLVEYKKRSTVCPQCRRSGSSFPDQRSERHIKSLKVKCNNHTNGCKWIGEVNSLEEHTQHCDYSLVDCPLKCKAKILLKDVQTHKNQQCPNRIVSCELCQEKGKAIKISTSHLNTCPKVNIDCFNDGCSVRVPRGDLLDHRCSCPYEKRSCKYRNIGCKTVVNRKDLDDHEKDIQSHFLLALDKIDHLTAVVSTLDSKFRSQELAAPKFTFKLANFSELKQSSTKFVTPSFHSHPGGYRLSGTIYANGDGTYKGKSISVFMRFHHGQNDSELTWPFTGSYTIELLNQLEDDKHYNYELSYPTGTNDETNNILKSKHERTNLAYGCFDFIRHTELEYKPELNRQYLKDDCLYFRFTVHPPQQPKPWLTCTQ